MDFFNNVWVIGISTGLISGFIIFFIIRFLSSKKENKDYMRKVQLANNEILYAIRLFIVENKLPSKDDINSLLLSTSKKYDLRYSDIYDIHNLVDDLVKEILDNTFLSSAEKNDFCLTTRKLLLEENESKEIIYIKSPTYNTSKYISLVLGLTTALFTFFSIWTLNKNIQITENFNKLEFLKYLIILLIIPIVSLLTTQLIREFKRRKNRKLSEVEKIKGFTGYEGDANKKEDKKEN